MSCPALHLDDGGLADALKSIDCRTGEATAVAFERLFGSHGTLMPVLTGLLTLYVAIFAIGLLTGRTQLGVSSLTPRMLTLGLALTFATSWLAYEHVVWTLAVGAPDQIATVIAGTHGSATSAFAQRLDTIFVAIADSTKQTPTSITTAAPAMANGANNTGVNILSPQGMIWISGLMLLIGTVGVMITAKIALAALLALGPLFIILAIFPGTRGLFEGWLKAVVSFALVPLFTVLIGGGMIALITPLIRNALMDSTEIATRSATSLFLASVVYCALMVMIVRVTGMLVAGWRLPFSAAPETTMAAAAPAPALNAGPTVTILSPTAADAGQRVRSIMASLPASAGNQSEASVTTIRAQSATAGLLPTATDIAAPRAADRRLQGVGSRFRAPPPAMPSKARLS